MHKAPNLPLVLLFLGLLALPESGQSQIVPIKTVPVAVGDQFLLFPSDHLGMGGPRLALADTLGDPFVNPATGSRMRESSFFGSPAFYHISDRNGSGRSLPLGTQFRSGDWFGGGAVSLQELSGAKRGNGGPIPWFSSFSPPPGQLLSEGSSRNLYTFGMLGRSLPEHGISIGLSGFWADLSAMDGVDLLYANSQQVQQSGTISDLRLGAVKEWGDGRALEVLILRSKLRMRHEVTYQDLIWAVIDPGPEPLPQWRARVEKNLDHTDTWGTHVTFRKPLPVEGWTMGWSLTGNWKSHPKIPNYEIQNIPRDPGDTRAFAFGMGIAKSEGSSRFAVDVVLEPIESETWADAASDTLTVMGKTILAGEKTVENDFRFTNVLVRGGGEWDFRKATFRLGLQARSISYELDQLRRVEVDRRHQEESWMEWTPSLGVSLHLSGLTLHYAALRTTGTGRPGTRWSEVSVPLFDNAAGGDILLAPSGPLTLQDASVTTHQLSVVVPIG